MNRSMLSALVFALAAILGVDGRSAFAQNVQTGGFPERWIDGTDYAREPAVQVHWYNPATAILRQSLCTNFEGPFLYVLFGTEEALLLDTGASGIDLKSTMEEVIQAWETRFARRLRRLVVAHSHSHGDHVSGDAELRSIAHAEGEGRRARRSEAKTSEPGWGES
jgi:hydroxyacylglutathione hydrolase